MRPVMVSGILVLVGVVGLGSLWPRPGRALAPRVLDSRAAERAMNHTLHDFQAVLQCRRHAGQARAPQAPIPARSASWCGPAAVPSPILSRPAWGQAPAQEEPQRGLETLPDSLELVSPRPKEETARRLEYGLAAAERAEDEAQREATQYPRGSRGSPRAVASQGRAEARRHAVDDRMARSVATHELEVHDLLGLLRRRAHQLRTWAEEHRKEAQRLRAKGDVKGARVWEDQAQHDASHAQHYEDQVDRIEHTGRL